MANNFHIIVKRNNNKSLILRLFGDFDASSACELINLLDESQKKSNRVTIDTDGLSHIDSFGLSVFLPRLSKPNKTLPHIEMVGKFSKEFLEE